MGNMENMEKIVNNSDVDSPNEKKFANMMRRHQNKVNRKVLVFLKEEKPFVLMV